MIYSNSKIHLLNEHYNDHFVYSIIPLLIETIIFLCELSLLALRVLRLNHLYILTSIIFCILLNYHFYLQVSNVFEIEPFLQLIHPVEVLKDFANRKHEISLFIENNYSEVRFLCSRQ